MTRARLIGLATMAAIISGCTTSHDLSEFDNIYVGRLNDECYGDVHLMARVINGKLLLPLPGHRDIRGTVAPDGTVTAAGDWSDERGQVHAELNGQIAGKMLGHTLTATIHDGRCNPDIALAPEPKK
jgi:hypothetical protein